VHYEIIGVVGDIQKFAVTPGQTSRLADPSMLSQMYKPFSQDVLSSAVLGVRGKAGTLGRAGLIGALKALIWQQDKTIPLNVFRTTEEIVARSIATQRFYALLFGAFALVALLMSLAGIYGVLSFTVAQRTREIGIRMALGAQAFDVQRLIVRQGLWLSCSGLFIGTLAAFGLTRLLKSMLYETSTTDPRTFAVVACALLLIALAACWIPARRATKVDPMIALRCE
jgi:putative ABC transport system permease protein